MEVATEVGGESGQSVCLRDVGVCLKCVCVFEISLGGVLPA